MLFVQYLEQFAALKHALWLVAAFGSMQFLSMEGDFFDFLTNVE